LGTPRIRHFPLSDVHLFAQEADETAEFASTQGLFWQMHDLLYVNQRQLNMAALLASALALGLSQATFEAALTNQTYGPKVDEDFLGGV
jgi:protein-disulfide isomerase